MAVRQAGDLLGDLALLVYLEPITRENIAAFRKKILLAHERGVAPTPTQADLHRRSASWDMEMAYYEGKHSHV